MPIQDTNENAGTSQVLARYSEAAVIGAGLIGLSWAALFLANGLRVRVYDPRSDLEMAPVPVIAQLGNKLEEYRELCGSPQAGWIFPNSVANPRCMDDLARDVIRPTL
jgi:NADPH-dependent 2,4-dienoyl-CoA reductase/sulfur reductase-like enzyme